MTETTRSSELGRENHAIPDFFESIPSGHPLTKGRWNGGSKDISSHQAEFVDAHKSYTVFVELLSPSRNAEPLHIGLYEITDTSSLPYDYDQLDTRDVSTGMEALNAMAALAEQVPETDRE